MSEPVLALSSAMTRQTCQERPRGDSDEGAAGAGLGFAMGRNLSGDLATVERADGLRRRSFAYPSWTMNKLRFTRTFDL